MSDRYVKYDHPSNVSLANNASNIWKRIWTVRDDAEAKIRWLIGKGDIDISLDRWLDHPMTHSAKGPVHSLFLSNKELDFEITSNLHGYNNAELIK